DSHLNSLRFPAPSGGLGDSLNQRQSAAHIRLTFIHGLWFAGHIVFEMTHREQRSARCKQEAKQKAPFRGLLAQWCQNSAINRMIGSGTPSSHRSAPLVKSMSSSSKVTRRANAEWPSRFPGL